MYSQIQVLRKSFMIKFCLYQNIFINNPIAYIHCIINLFGCDKICLIVVKRCPNTLFCEDSPAFWERVGLVCFSSWREWVVVVKLVFKMSYVDAH